MTHASKPRLNREHVLTLLSSMIRIRMFEDKCAELYTQEKIRGFLHLYDGEEAIAAGIIPVLKEADRLVATYREHGHALVRGVSMNAIMAEMFGKTDGCSMGRGGSMHLFDAATNFYGGNAIVGGGLPLAVGLALQGTLSHFAAGVMLLVFRPFRVGDLCRIGEDIGHVEAIGLRSTRIRTLERSLVTGRIE